VPTTEVRGRPSCTEQPRRLGAGQKRGCRFLGFIMLIFSAYEGLRRRLSSVVEHRSCKPVAAGSNPAVGYPFCPFFSCSSHGVRTSALPFVAFFGGVVCGPVAPDKPSAHFCRWSDFCSGRAARPEKNPFVWPATTCRFHHGAYFSHPSISASTLRSKPANICFRYRRLAEHSELYALSL
jgi:hypothetical protein